MEKPSSKAARLAASDEDSQDDVPVASESGNRDAAKVSALPTDSSASSTDNGKGTTSSSIVGDTDGGVASLPQESAIEPQDWDGEHSHLEMGWGSITIVLNRRFNVCVFYHSVVWSG